MPKPDDDRREDGQQGRGGQLPLGGGGADGDDPPVFGLLGVVHDPGVLAELAPHLLDHGAGRAADGPDGQRREEEGDRAADEQADEDGRVGHVDLSLDVVNSLAARGVQAGAAADGLDERGEQGHRGDDRRADGHPLGDRLGGVAHRVEADHDPLGLAGELAGHLGDAGGVVRHRAEAVLGDHHAGGGQQADAGEGHQVEGQLDVAVTQADGHHDGHDDGDDGPHRGLEADGDAGQHGGGRARCGPTRRSP